MILHQLIVLYSDNSVSVVVFEMLRSVSDMSWSDLRECDIDFDFTVTVRTRAPNLRKYSIPGKFRYFCPPAALADDFLGG